MRYWLRRESSRLLAAILSYEWIFLICFLSNVTIAFAIGSKMSGGPYFWPFVTAQLSSFLMLAAFAPDDFCTSTYV